MKRAFLESRVCSGVATAVVLASAGCAARHPAPTPAEPRPTEAITAPAATPPAPIIPAPPPARPTDTVLVAGAPVSVGTRVVLFDEPGGYNAYRGPSYFNQRRDETRSAPKSETASKTAPQPAHDRAALNQLIDRVVLHYDVAGLSSRCFRTLQEERGLSCHFLLDVDGTVYQTLDLQERAWHAGTSNSRSVGIEIANPGAYPKGASSPLSRWYRPHPERGTRLILPPDAGVRHPDRARAPARPLPVTGPIHGRQLVQYDLTDAQYASLIKLVAALCRTFPRVAPDAPRVGGNPDAPVLPGLMTAADRVRFGGIVGHHHLTRDMSDPGPAFDWPRLLRGVRAELRDAPPVPPADPHRGP